MVTSTWLGDKFGWPVEPEHLVPVPSVMRILEVALLHFTTPDSAVLVPTPAFPPFLSLAGEQGRRVMESPMLRQDGRWVLDLEHLEHCLRAGARLLVLCNPVNPAGTVLTHAQLLAVSEMVDRYGVRVRRRDPRATGRLA
jgi:cystathionine beta-lyase